MGGLTALATGGFSLLKGMSVTIRAFFSKPVTAQYPHVEPELTDAYRSAIALIRFDETGTHDCVACMQCEIICPSFCITIEGGRVEGMKKKRATKFDMDFALCSLCGLCIDVCPTYTLKYSKIYDEAGYQRDWNFDLLDGFREGEAAYLEVAKAEEAKKAAERDAKRAAAKAAKEAAAAAEPAPEADSAPAPEAESAPAADAAPAAEAAPDEAAPPGDTPPAETPKPDDGEAS